MSVVQSSPNGKQKNKAIEDNSLNISINEVINKIQPKVQNSTKLIDIKDCVKSLSKDSSVNAAAVKKDVRKITSPVKLPKTCDKKIENNDKELVLYIYIHNSSRYSFII